MRPRRIAPDEPAEHAPSPAHHGRHCVVQVPAGVLALTYEETADIQRSQVDWKAALERPQVKKAARDRPVHCLPRIVFHAPRGPSHNERASMRLARPVDAPPNGACRSKATRCLKIVHWSYRYVPVVGRQGSR